MVEARQSSDDDKNDKDPLSAMSDSMPRMSDVDREGLWSIGRFVEQIMGEIPRLRDDEKGYGAQGEMIYSPR